MISKRKVKKYLSLAAFITMLLMALFGKDAWNQIPQPNNKNDVLGEKTELILATVTEIVDGDTVKIKLDNSRNHEELTIRLIGIDTPETVHPNLPVECFGKEASNYLDNKINYSQVQIELDLSQGEYDRYGRTLGYVWKEGRNINKEMLAEGYGFEYTYSKPYKYKNEFEFAEQQARLNKKGLWDESICNYQPEE